MVARKSGLASEIQPVLGDALPLTDQLHNLGVLLDSLLSLNSQVAVGRSLNAILSWVNLTWWESFMFLSHCILTNSISSSLGLPFKRVWELQSVQHLVICQSGCCYKVSRSYSMTTTLKDLLAWQLLTGPVPRSWF